MIRKVLLVTALLGGAVLLARGPVAWACSCTTATTKQQFKSAKVVFIGTVSKVETFTEPAGEDGVRATFAVSESYKGRIPQTVDVATPPNVDACGLPFVPGNRYTVFAEVLDGALWADACDGTAEEVTVLRKAGIVKPLAVFGPGARAPATSDGSSRAAPIAAALLLALAVATGVFLRGRRPATGSA